MIEGSSGGPTTHEIEVTASFPVDSTTLTTNTEIKVWAEPGTADATDFAASPITVTIPAGETSGTGTFQLTVIGDTLVEGDETVPVEGASGSLVVASATLTITDDDTTTVTLGAATVEENVDGGTVTVTATLDNPVQGGFTVEASTGDGTATAPGDYTTTTTMLTFVGTEGETQTFMVEIINDGTVEPRETFNVSLGTPVPATAPAGRISVVAGTVTITDNDTATLSLVVPDNPVSEDSPGASATITAMLDNPVQGGFTVTVSTTSTVDDTATPGPGGDYTPITNRTLTFLEGSTQQIFEVEILDDSAVEREETFHVSLGGLAGTTLPVQLGPDAVVRITTDDFLVLTWADSIRVDEGMVAVVTATLENPVEGGFTVSLRIEGVTATGGSDYTPTSGTLSFEGETGETETFEVMIVDDAVFEGEETFSVSLDDIVLTPASAPSPPENVLNFFPRLETVTVTIIDNDTAGVTISETAVEVTEGEAAATYMVVLSSAPAVSATVTIDPGSSTTAPITVAPAALTLTFGSDDWDTAQAVTVTATEDDDAIGGLRTLAHTVTGYGEVSGAASVAVTVLDNDTAGVTISETAVEVTEGEAAATYMVVLSSAPAVSATVTIDPGSSTTAPITVAPAALTLTFGSDDWDTAQAVTVTATEDDDAIGGLRTLAHTVTGYGAVPAVASVAVTVLDNDTAGVTISETAVEVTEGEAAATYMVVLSSAPAVSATVTIDPGSSTTAPITVAPAALTLTFGSDDWDTAQAVTVTATEDDDAIGGLRTLAHTVTGYGAVSGAASVR